MAKGSHAQMSFSRRLMRWAGCYHCGHRKDREMMLKDKTGVIYGAGGAIGCAVAHALSRLREPIFFSPVATGAVEVVAKDIVSAGGSAEAAEVDALDEQAVEEHLQSVIDKAGRLDISFNTVGIPDTTILGIPLVELDVDQFSLPIATYEIVLSDRAPSSPADGSE